jgi:hypothetical protein
VLLEAQNSLSREGQDPRKEVQHRKKIRGDLCCDFFTAGFSPDLGTERGTKQPGFFFHSQFSQQAAGNLTLKEIKYLQNKL